MESHEFTEFVVLQNFQITPAPSVSGPLLTPDLLPMTEAAIYFELMGEWGEGTHI